MTTATLTTGEPKHYLSCAETAKLLRTALKNAFPGVKFSVRSDTYAGGASIRVRWTDGPTTGEVNAVAKQYEGAGFDGMQDLKYSCSHWMLPNGTVELAAVHHNLDPKQFQKPHPEARRVSFGADYVFAERELSLAFRVKVAARALAEFGLSAYTPLLAPDCVEQRAWGPAWSPKLDSVWCGSCWATDLLHRASVTLRGDGTPTHDSNGTDLGPDTV